ncbi:MAG: DUF3267 domain-containing protein [Saprospiraceae bacterium]
MKPTIDALFDESEYLLLEELPYTEMIPFVQRDFQYPTNIIRFYIALNVLLLIVIIGVAALQISAGKITFGNLFYAVSLGFAASLTLLIPIHEAIHGLAYKIAGAPKVSFGGNLRKFYFYAVADRFVAGAREFRLVALAPFVVISFTGTIILIFSPIFFQWLLWGVLLLHTGACAGDFAMLAFYARLSNDKIFTFDDVKAQKAYFFQKKSKS